MNNELRAEIAADMQTVIQILQERVKPRLSHALSYSAFDVLSNSGTKTERLHKDIRWSYSAMNGIIKRCSRVFEERASMENKHEN